MSAPVLDLDALARELDQAIRLAETHLIGLRAQRDLVAQLTAQAETHRADPAAAPVAPHPAEPAPSAGE